MSIKLIAGLVASALLAFLVYFSYSQTSKLAVANTKLKEAAAQLDSLNQAKIKSDEAVAQLTIDLNKNQEVVTKTITKLVKVPVSSDEKCMSLVLKEALK